MGAGHASCAEDTGSAGDTRRAEVTRGPCNSRSTRDAGSASCACRASHADAAQASDLQVLISLDAPLNQRFKAKLRKSPAKGGWTYVAMPDSAAFFGAKGLVKVSGAIDGQPFRSTERKSISEFHFSLHRISGRPALRANSGTIGRYRYGSRSTVQYPCADTEKSSLHPSFICSVRRSP